MTNTRTIMGAMAWMAVSCLMMMGAFEPIGTTPALAAQAPHAIY